MRRPQRHSGVLNAYCTEVESGSPRFGAATEFVVWWSARVDVVQAQSKPVPEPDDAGGDAAGGRGGQGGQGRQWRGQDVLEGRACLVQGRQEHLEAPCQGADGTALTATIGRYEKGQ